MKSGWIRVDRKILENPVVNQTPETFYLWMWLLLNAAHEDRTVYFNGERVELKAGQLVTSRREMSRLTGISEGKIQRTTELLENEQLIEQQTNHKNRLISIVSWRKYQKSEPQNEPQTNRKTNHLLFNKTNKQINNITREAAKAEFSVPEHDDSAALLALLQNLTEEE